MNNNEVSAFLAFSRPLNALKHCHVSSDMGLSGPPPLQISEYTMLQSIKSHDYQLMIFLFRFVYEA